MWHKMLRDSTKHDLLKKIAVEILKMHRYSEDEIKQEYGCKCGNKFYKVDVAGTSPSRHSIAIECEDVEPSKLEDLKKIFDVVINLRTEDILSQYLRIIERYWTIRNNLFAFGFAVNRHQEIVDEVYQFISFLGKDISDFKWDLLDMEF